MIAHLIQEVSDFNERPGGSVAKSCPTLATPWTAAHQAPLCPWDSPRKNPGGGCHFLLQGIFLTQ